MLTRPLWQPDARVMMMTWGCGPMCKELIPSLEQHSIHLDSLAQQMRVLIAIQQRMLDVLEKAEGLPLGDPYIIDALAPAQNVITYGPVIPQASILRNLSIAPTAASVVVTVYVKSAYAIADSQVKGVPAGNRVIWRGGVDSLFPVTFPWRTRLPAGSQLGIATSATTETELVLNAVIDQVEATSTDQFYGRR